jgi:pterin-4a-carbinolamine dehydratase
MSENVEEVTINAVSEPLRRPPIKDELKAERVQEALRQGIVSMPGWRLSRGIPGIDRMTQFPSPRVAGAYAAFVSEFADQVGQHCSVTRAGRQVTVSVLMPSRRGQSFNVKPVLDFAQRLH